MSVLGAQGMLDSAGHARRRGGPAAGRCPAPAPRSPAAPTRSSGASSASGCSGCPRSRGPTGTSRSGTSPSARSGPTRNQRAQTPGASAGRLRWNLTLARRSRSSARSCGTGSRREAPDGPRRPLRLEHGLTGGGNRDARLAAPIATRPTRSGTAKLAAKRLICPQWPEEYGGQGMDAVRLAVLNEEFHRAGVPRVHRGMGESLVGPSIIVHGTPEQRAFFLPRIISGEDVYCQGFSEPDHGSDLAGVETRGVVDGDEVVITGQKVWTSGAARANLMFVLVPDRPGRPKAPRPVLRADPIHRRPASSYRPIRQMSGAAEFCEDFIDGVRAPLFNVIGGLGQRLAGRDDHARQRARRPGDHGAPGLRARVLGAGRDGAQARQDHRPAGAPAARLGLHAGRAHALQRACAPWPRLAAGRTPGPEASVAKLFWSEYHKRLGEIAIDIEGRDGLLRPDGAGYPDRPLAERVPRQPGRHDLLGHQRDPAEHHR